MAGPTGKRPAPPRPGFGSRRIELLLIGVVSALVAGVAVFAMRYARNTPPAAPGAAPAAPVQVLNAPLPLAPSSGLTDTEVVFGMAAPFSGAAKELGRGMKAGFEAAFAAANAAGGVHGRKLKLVALDDGYEPDRTKAVMKELVEDRKVFGIAGNVGTPTAQVAVPYAMEKKVLFYGAFTGAPLLRKSPPDRYVFNFRASYAEETMAAVRYLTQVRRVAPDEIGVFAQEDGYGDAGFEGVAAALAAQKRQEGQILRVGYKRNSADVDEAVARIAREGQKLKAVVMVATYKAAARFVEKVRATRPDLIVTSVSFVGSIPLAEELAALGPKMTADVIVTQVVPLPTSHATAVMKYREALAQYVPGEAPEFVSLEAFVAANILIEGLRRAGRELTTEALVDALEGIQGLDLGIGTPLGFSRTDHQASHKVWGTTLDPTGKFKSLDLE